MFLKKITIRVPEDDYQIIQINAAKNGETISYYLRKIISREIKSDAALTNQDALITAVRKAIRLELKNTENRLASLAAKTAITSATTENLVAYIVKHQSEHNLQEVRNACRKRGVAYVREPLEKIMQAYDEGGDN